MGQWGIAQAQHADYFQQEVHYQIQVHLDDQQHILTGDLELVYINHSPDELPFIWFHLWPNAYRDQATAFAHQQRVLGNTEFHFAKDSQMGYIDSLQFAVNGQAARLEYHAQHQDQAKLWLPQPLQAGDSIRISTPFRVKIPDSFSRLGHVGQSYQITQWYPKPAVYDPSGWHPMSYLDQGEFYSEFGSFEVRITLPENYVVGATGTLESKQERAFLLQKAAETKTYLDTLPVRPSDGYVFEPFPPSSDQYKTLRYTADRVHDFAWFADKRFRVQHSQVAIATDRQVETWTMFTNTELQLWRKSIDYVNRSLSFYTELVGDYPYPQATAVQSALSAGGGMEYPMITVIDFAGNARNLDEVITHEIGHNWFYGALASNERDHAWLDEGLNTFYEQRYIQTYYPGSRQQFVPEFLTEPGGMELEELTYMQQSRRRLDRAPDSPIEDFNNTNYWLGAYYKPAAALNWLYHYWGAEKFDRAMQGYYQQWQLRHPQPEDFRNSLESSSAEKLDWLFDGLLYATKQADYALTGLKRAGDRYRITIRNRGDIPAPFPLYGLKDGTPVVEQWIEGFSGSREITLPATDIERFSIDHFHQTLDINRKNNQIRTAGSLPRVAPFRLAPIAKLENENYTSLFALPILGWNAYDGLMPGLILHNRSLPYKKLEFDLHPAYGIRSRSFVGLGNIHYRIYPQKTHYRELYLGLNFRRFHYRKFAEQYLRYQRWEPILKIHFWPGQHFPFSHYMQFRWIDLSREMLVFPSDHGQANTRMHRNGIFEFQYGMQFDGAVNPTKIRVTAEVQHYHDDFGELQNYLKMTLDWRSKFYYAVDRAVSARFFLGGLPVNSKRAAGGIFPGALSLIDHAVSDYRFDDFYFDRSGQEGFLTQQLALRDGGFKTPINPAFNLGKSNNFIVAVNLKADLPFGNYLPIYPYLDLGYFDNSMPTGKDATFSDQFLWSGGIGLEVLDGRAGLYFPLINSKNLQDRLAEKGNYWRRIAFRLDLYGEKVREILEKEW